MNLRTIIIFALLVCACILPLHAQVGEQRHNFAVGVNGGINLNSVSFSPKVRQNNLMGINGGVTARYISEKYFSMICGIQAEVNYSQRGWKEIIEDGTEDTYHRAMNYLEVPLLAHLAFGKDRGNGVRFVLNLGPQIGFLINEKEYKSAAWHPEDRPYGVNVQYDKAAENKFDYGIIGGGGVEIRTGIGHFVAEARYYFGLSDFFNSTKKDYFSRSAHSYITAKLTYLFDITR